MAYSVQRAVSDGTLSTITLDIDFFAKEHISVLVADRVLPNDNYTFSWISSNTIKIVPNVANGAEVLIRRNTPYGECFHNFRLGAVFKDETMDENFKQVLFLTQEAIEGQTSTDFYTDLNFHGYKLRNVGPAIAAFDAIPLSQYQGDALGAYQSRLAADAYRVAANAAKDAAAASASSSAASATTASTKASEASASATTASKKATEASTSAASASSSASAAAGSLESANASATASLNSKNAAKASETAAAASASTASTKASAAANSAAEAAASATAASSSATAASTSATNAGASATSATASASSAAGSASTAGTKASAASASATTASQKATEASTSAGSADTSAKAASASATAAAGSASAASASKDAAKASETAAAASATSASTSASSASASASTASAAATTTTQKATQAETSATNAANSASAAAASATNAANSASAAKGWAQVAHGAALPDGGITPAKLSPEVNAKFVDAAGDTMTGPLVLGNNVQLQSKDSGGNVKTILYVGPEGNLNITNGPAGATKFLKSDGSSAVAYVDNSGNIKATGDIITDNSIRLPANGVLYGKNNAGEAYSMVRSDGIHTNIVNGNGTKVRVINKAYTAELVGIDDSGNMNVNGDLTVGGKNAVRSVNGINADASGNVTINVSGFVPTDSNGAVGTFGFFQVTTANQFTCNPGDTVPGSILRYAGLGMGNNTAWIATADNAPAGTWRALGFAKSRGDAKSYGATVFQRIS